MNSKQFIILITLFAIQQVAAMEPKDIPVTIYNQSHETAIYFIAETLFSYRALSPGHVVCKIVGSKNAGERITAENLRGIATRARHSDFLAKYDLQDPGLSVESYDWNPAIASVRAEISGKDLLIHGILATIAANGLVLLTPKTP